MDGNQSYYWQKNMNLFLLLYIIGCKQFQDAFLLYVYSSKSW